MGNYLNPKSIKFQKSLRSDIYIDKSELITKLNKRLNTEQGYLCVSRPRRFGKSMAMNMLAAYYGSSEDTAALFAGLKASQAASFTEHLNKYNVLHINMQDFASNTQSVKGMIERLTRFICRDAVKDFQGIELFETSVLSSVMSDIYSYTGRQFVILIDEWDCLFRAYKKDKDEQERYLDFLRTWMKDQPYVAMAYMTGILPIKKYGTHSALNMFTEYSMIEPRDLAGYFGFTEEEVKALCVKYHMPFEETQAWYDGYELLYSEGRLNQRKVSIYNPKAVVDAMMTGNFGPYWNNTETYEALRDYIALNMDGLRDAVTLLMADNEVPVDIRSFANDMTTFRGRDDVLTLLIHLGYLSYDQEKKTVRIPNKEVNEVYFTSIKDLKWDEVVNAVQDSRKLLQALWDCDAQAVADGVEKVHQEIAILRYNDENSLSCCIHMAFYFAREYYTVFRELPTGKGFADLVFVPRQKYADKPACVIELKWDKDVHGAISQIKERQYTASLKDYCGNILLAGINYDRTTKTHTCVIERVEK